MRQQYAYRDILSELGDFTMTVVVFLLPFVDFVAQSHDLGLLFLHVRRVHVDLGG